MIRKRKERAGQGFSLVEVVVALGLVVFALITLLALLPIGIKSNQVATGESKAIDILTSLEADLRNSFTSSGTSLIFGANTSNPFNIEAPYLGIPAPAPATTGGKLIFNSNVTLNELYTTGLTDAETPMTPALGLPYQASVIYTKIPATTPAAGSLAPMEARLIVNWPCLAATATAVDLTNPAKVSNFVEAYVTFPAP